MKAMSKRYWRAVCLVLIVGGGWVAFSFPKQLDPTGNQKIFSSSLGAAEINAANGDEAKKTGINNVAIPLGLIKSSNIKAFDDKACQLSDDVISLLSLNYREKPRVEELVSSVIRDFLQIEAEHSQLISNGDDLYIKVNPCAEAAKSLFLRLSKELEAVVGCERASVITVLISKQLRNGGKDAIELGNVAIPETGKTAILWRLVNDRGEEYSSIEGDSGVAMKDLARWKTLDDRFYAARRGSSPPSQ
ncbi:hypothetical protein [Haloferula sp. BvORR071]|uniref:hypothetical protein n=1 Tax=Haloferula sp. BvORR071 TaxID=1396141 RepID=UPI002241040C|nr:hypothetical protein [Haloferula sp. BvORR071]